MSHADGILATLSQSDMQALTQAMKAETRVTLPNFKTPAQQAQEAIAEAKRNGDHREARRWSHITAELIGLEQWHQMRRNSKAKAKKPPSSLQAKAAS